MHSLLAVHGRLRLLPSCVCNQPGHQKTCCSQQSIAQAKHAVLNSRHVYTRGQAPLGLLHLCAQPMSVWASCALLSTVPCCAESTLVTKTLAMLMLATQAYILMRY